jgi:hypothetical protein
VTANSHALSSSFDLDFIQLYTIHLLRHQCVPFRSNVLFCLRLILFYKFSYFVSIAISNFWAGHTEKYFLEVSEAAPRPAEYRFVCQKAFFKHNLIVKRLYLMPQVYLPKKFCKHYNIYKNIFDRIKPRQESCLIKLPFMVLLTFLCFED